MYHPGYKQHSTDVMQHFPSLSLLQIDVILTIKKHFFVKYFFVRNIHQTSLVTLNFTQEHDEQLLIYCLAYAFVRIFHFYLFTT